MSTDGTIVFSFHYFFTNSSQRHPLKGRCFQRYQGDIGWQGRRLGPLSFIWFVNRISVIFDYVRVLFCADDMKLFLPVQGFQHCMKMQSHLKKLSEWCERNSLFLNVDKCKIISLHAGWNCIGSGKLYKRSRGHHGRVDEFFGAYDVIVGKAFAMLGFIRRLSFEFRDPYMYTLRSLYTSLICSKLEYAKGGSRIFS
jgi:hypothetical protein